MEFDRGLPFGDGRIRPSGSLIGGRGLVTRTLPESKIKSWKKSLVSQAGLFSPQDLVSSNGFPWQLGMYGQQFALIHTAGLASRALQDMFFVGGICTLSTYESGLLRNQEAEFPKDGLKIADMSWNELVRGFRNMLSRTPITLMIEAIGPTPMPGAVVIEDRLWTDRITGYIQKTRGNRESDAQVRELVGGFVRARNRLVARGVAGLRTFMFGPDVKPLRFFSDVDVWDQLTTGTDTIIEKLGLPKSNDSYRFIYAGMYTFVWRNALIAAGIMPKDKVMVIYEPAKHFMPEEKPGSDEVRNFRIAVKRKAPYLEPGSPNSMVGLIATASPSIVGGGWLRDKVPSDELPTCSNFRTFDFAKYPRLENSRVKLSENPKFLWGSRVYPPTRQTYPILRSMEDLADRCSEETGRETSLVVGATAIRGAADRVEDKYTEKMERLGKKLTEVLDEINAVALGDSYANRE